MSTTLEQARDYLRSLTIKPQRWTVSSYNQYETEAVVRQLLTELRAARAAAGSQWPAPLAFPDHRPAAEGEQYYVLTDNDPQQAHLKLWRTNNDTGELTWMDWDEGYYPSTDTVTDFWPIPTAPTA